MKKGGKKYIIYVVSNSYVSSSFYLKVVSQPMWSVGWRNNGGILKNY
jgi:hypothetical protein